MTYSDFLSLVENNPDGVVLLEGRRTIPPADAALAAKFAGGLARRFPRLRFRSGNAEGSDKAFSDPIAAFDASRLQIIAPYASQKKSTRYDDACYDSPETLSTLQEEEAVYKTIEATPKNKNLISRFGKGGRLGAQAACLIRDTMKVMGYSETFGKPICAFFYVDFSDPMAGGTGHTIRVCKQEKVPFAFQDSWGIWEEVLNLSE